MYREVKHRGGPECSTCSAGACSLEQAQTLLWHNEHVSISVGQTAVVHGHAGSVHMYGKAILSASAASATNGRQASYKIHRV